MYSEVIGGETIENNDEKQLDSTPVQLQSFYTNIRSLRMILSAAFLWRAGVTSAGKRRHRLR